MGWRWRWRAFGQLLTGVAPALLAIALIGSARTAVAQTESETDTAAGSAPRIGVLTIGPGSEYWSRFGHNAIIVDRGAGPALSYNYGYFDFDQPNFLLRFVQGRMLYILAQSTLDRELAQYAAEGRSVRLQWLQMTPEQRLRVADYLDWNARPENAEYRYDYFLANCSTRVRDVLDEALSGELRRQGGSRSRGMSYRSEAMRLSAEVVWMLGGIHLLLGPRADRPLSRWEESFAPEHFAELLDLARTSTGAPLVAASLPLLPQEVAPSAPSAPRFWFGALLLSGLAAGWLAWLGRRRESRGFRWSSRITAAYWLGNGLIGLGMLALWFATDHSMAGENRNLLLFNPLGWLLLPALWAGRARALGVATGWLLAAGWVAACALLFLSVRDQDTLEWLLFCLPWLLLTHGLLGALPATHLVSPAPRAT